jgi:hypothetical protein
VYVIELYDRPCNFFVREDVSLLGGDAVIVVCVQALQLLSIRGTIPPDIM